MIGQIEQRIDLSDRHPLVRLAHFHDLVASANFTLLKNTEVEAGLPARCQQRRHAGLIHADADSVASHAWLADLEKRGTDLEAVPDAHGIIRQAFYREILPKLPVNEIAAL